MIKKGISHLGIFFLGVLSLLPLPILYTLANISYVLIYSVFGYRKKVVRTNLINALPEKTLTEIKHIERRFFKYLSTLIFEIVKMSSISKKEIEKRFIFRNKEIVQAYLDQGESILVCSAHYGNWEWGTLGIGLNFNADHYPIYKPLSNTNFDNWFKKVRSRFGNKLVPMRQTMRALAASKGTASIFSFGNDNFHFFFSFLKTLLIFKNRDEFFQYFD